MQIGAKIYNILVQYHRLSEKTKNGPDGFNFDVYYCRPYLTLGLVNRMQKEGKAIWIRYLMCF